MPLRRSVSHYELGNQSSPCIRVAWIGSWDAPCISSRRPPCRKLRWLLIPSRVRGRVDLIINGSYWIGAAIGAGATLVLLDPHHVPIWLGWRFAFGIGATLGLIVIFFVAGFRRARAG